MTETAQLVHDGRFVKITPAADIAAGDVVTLGPAANTDNLCGIAPVAIPAGRLGNVDTEGVHLVPKAAEAMGAGRTVYWNTASGAAQLDPADAIPLGKALESAAPGDSLVRIALNRQ